MRYFLRLDAACRRMNHYLYVRDERYSCMKTNNKKINNLIWLLVLCLTFKSAQESLRSHPVLACLADILPFYGNV